MLVLLLIAGFTGGILAFRTELDRALNPDWFVVSARAQRLALQDVIDAVEQHFPDAYVTTVRLPKSPEDALRISLGSRASVGVAHVHTPGMKMTLDVNEVFADPYTGHILGFRNTSRFALTARGFIPTALRLHYSLFAGKLGAYLMGTVACLWLLSSLVGFALSWPRPFLSAAAWVSALGVRWRGGSFRLDYDLHRSGSLLFLPVLITIAFTGIYLDLPSVVKPVVDHISKLPEAPRLQARPVGVPEISPDNAIAAGLRLLPHAVPYSITRSFANGTYAVRMRLPTDVSPSGNNLVYLSMVDGSVARTALASEVGAGQRYLHWQLPLHDGQAFGFMGQLVITLTGFIIVLACITGLRMWWRKTHFLAPANATATRRTPAPASVPSP